MPMQNETFVCPCCGAPIQIGESITVVSELEQARIASSLGVELGVLKGGEKIGD